MLKVEVVVAIEVFVVDVEIAEIVELDVEVVVQPIKIKVNIAPATYTARLTTRLLITTSSPAPITLRN